MLWAVRNKWPSVAQFTFKCYRHWATLVVQDTGDRSGHFMHSKEGALGSYTSSGSFRDPNPVSHSLGTLMTRELG